MQAQLLHEMAFFQLDQGSGSGQEAVSASHVNAKQGKHGNINAKGIEGRRESSVQSEETAAGKAVRKRLEEARISSWSLPLKQAAYLGRRMPLLPRICSHKASTICWDGRVLTQVEALQKISALYVESCVVFKEHCAYQAHIQLLLMKKARALKHDRLVRISSMLQLASSSVGSDCDSQLDGQLVAAAIHKLEAMDEQALQTMEQRLPLGDGSLVSSCDEQKDRRARARARMLYV